MDVAVAPLQDYDLEDAMAIASANPAREWDARDLLRALPPGGDSDFHCLAATEPHSAQVVGWLSARPNASNEKGRRLRVNIMVDPAFKRRGVASALLREFEAQARARGVLEIRARAYATETEAIAFMQARGFVEDHRMLYKILELNRAAAGDPSAAAARLEDEGIALEFRAFAGLSDDDIEGIAEVHNASTVDMTVYKGEPTPPQRASSLKRMLSAAADLPACVILARSGEDLAGYLAFNRLPGEPPQLNVGMIAVAPQFRRRGIAIAMRDQLLNFAQSNHFARLISKNRASNRPMAALNEAHDFGFRIEKVDIRFCKPLL